VLWKLYNFVIVRVFCVREQIFLMPFEKAYFLWRWLTLFVVVVVSSTNVLFRVLWWIREECLIKFGFVNSFFVSNLIQQIMVDVRSDYGGASTYYPKLAVSRVFSLLVENISSFHVVILHVPGLKPEFSLIILNGSSKLPKFSDYIIELLYLLMLVFKLVRWYPLRQGHLLSKI